jgi:NADP-dependent 3-hydroxy acid dehydrogenase YdfG
VTLDPLAGHVVVLAGVDAGVGTALLERGALLAVVTTDRAVIDELEAAAAAHPATVLLAYNADPGDPATWARLAPHIEQRVGPVDAALCTPAALDATTATFADDMRRRGHGAVVVLNPGQDPVATLRSQLHHTR